MRSFRTTQWADIQAQIERAERAKQNFNGYEMILQTLDERPQLEGEVGISCYPWAEGIIAGVFYSLPSIPDILPVLEWAERVFGGQFSSCDTAAGVREFKMCLDDELGLDFTVRVTPAEDAANATCRKVLVGEDVRTEIVRTPKYRLDCTGGAA